MDTNYYGPECDDLHAAIALYRQATIASPKINWIIEGRVQDIGEQLKDKVM